MKQPWSGASGEWGSLCPMGQRTAQAHQAQARDSHPGGQLISPTGLRAGSPAYTPIQPPCQGDPACPIHKVPLLGRPGHPGGLTSDLSPATVAGRCPCPPDPLWASLLGSGSEGSEVNSSRPGSGSSSGRKGPCFLPRQKRKAQGLASRVPATPPPTAGLAESCCS